MVVVDYEMGRMGRDREKWEKVRVAKGDPDATLNFAYMFKFSSF